MTDEMTERILRIKELLREGKTLQEAKDAAALNWWIAKP
jgi:hypothetical protein